MAEKSLEYRITDLKEKVDLLFTQMKSIREEIGGLKGGSNWEERIKRLEGYHV